MSAVGSKVTRTSTQVYVMSSQTKTTGTASTTVKATQAVDEVNPRKTSQTMQNFQKENMTMEMTEEMTNDILDDIFDSSDDDESEDTVNQVLDETGTEIFGNMAKAQPAA